MALFSRSKSTTQKTDITNNTTQGADNGSIILGEGASFTTVDPGARSIIAESNAFLGETFTTALGMVERQNQQFLEGIANDEIETTGDKITKYTPIAMAVAVAFVGWKVLT